MMINNNLECIETIFSSFGYSIYVIFPVVENLKHFYILTYHTSV